MLSIERVKELLNDPNISDKEAEEIRDEFRIFTEMIFDKWMAERDRAKNNEKKRSPKFKVEVVYKETPDAKDRLRQLWDLLLSLPDSDKAESVDKKT